MVNPERGQMVPNPEELKAALRHLEDALEAADEDENTIEREAKREALLENYDELQADLDAIEPSPNAHTSPLPPPPEDIA